MNTPPNKDSLTEALIELGLLYKLLIKHQGNARWSVKDTQQLNRTKEFLDKFLKQ